MSNNPYRLLAQRLDTLPNGFPPTATGVELRLLQKLFSPEEALLASQLRLTLETPEQLGARLERPPAELRKLLKAMTRRGLIAAGKTEGGLGFGLIPFVVGIYENQNEALDVELAVLFEEYFKTGLGQALAVQPSVHRVIPVNETVKAGLEIRPFESAADIVNNCQSWAVIDCICRKQKALVGEPCEHPLDVCLVLSSAPNAFDNAPSLKALTRQGALDTLRRAAEAGLVHSVSNNQKELWYICNCCLCSCGILRGMADLGMANVVAKSSYVNQVDPDLCKLCGTCLERCAFGALSLGTELVIDEVRCTGCGVCVIACPENALGLVLRDAEFVAVPETNLDWLKERAQARDQTLDGLL
jgi:ferredoxin